ncbi:protein pxr1-like [Lingula anatina]|uniref:Protein pxr1-like n=1 Tax=Lingula anatina TaxID=7574 RepID=A0A1S3JHL5_LINAN|nr:protein pxr1-like [Lingula anatina]|eukprot:XP_013409905.1 protein pxr1-like [Lingula anatina]
MASLRNGRTLNELVFSFKNAFYIAWYLLLIVLLFIAAEKAEDEMEIHVVEVQKNVTDVMRENVKRSRKQRAYLQDTEASLQNPVHGEKPRRSKNGNLHSLLLDETVKDGQEKVRKSRRKKSEKSDHRKRKDEGTVLDESAEAKRKEHRRKKKKGVSPRPKISPEATNEKDESSHDARFILSRDLHPV